MSKLYVIHAYEYEYEGTQGRENFCVVEADDLKDLEPIANEMSEDIICQWNYDNYEGDALEMGYEEGSEEFEDYCLNRMREDKVWSIYEIKNTKGLSEHELDEVLNKIGVESFVEEYSCEECK